MKLMKKEGDRYSLTTEAAMYLDPAQPTYRGDLWLFEYNWEGDGKLADVIRTGKRPLSYDATKEEMTGVWKAHYSRGWVFPEVLLELADELWRSVDIQARDGLRVLDVACGPAPRSLALAYHNASVRLTWLDWNEVLQTALKAASKVGITDQISPLPGDLWLADMGANQYDVAYLGNMTHFFSPEQNIHLFSKIHSALVSGGIIVVNSGVRREDVAAIWDAIWLYVATAHGGSYNFIEYKEMLEQAGFTNIEDINLGPIRAVKP